MRQKMQTPNFAQTLYAAAERASIQSYKYGFIHGAIAGIALGATVTVVLIILIT